jgi:NADPH:quinone reductase-like Zn-dependent oxidoreductase
MGLYGHHKSLEQGSSSELVPASDSCGTIVKIGPGSQAQELGLREGDRVASIFLQTHLTGQVQETDMASGLGLPLNGVLTQYRVFPAAALVKVPDYLSDDEVACLPIAAVTAWMSINSFQPLGQPLRGSDKAVLLQGTGGVAVSGLQIAKALGLTSMFCPFSFSFLSLFPSLSRFPFHLKLCVTISVCTLPPGLRLLLRYFQKPKIKKK